MSVIIGIGVGISSMVGLGGLAKFAIISGKKILDDRIRKKEKKILQNKLKDSIRDLDYNNFVDCIYEMKTYDDKYKKTLFIKSKKTFFFNDDHINKLQNFKRKFDRNYNEHEEYLRKIVRLELETSLSLIESRLNL